MPLDFLRQLWTGLRAVIALTLVLGLLYPVAVWGIGRIALRSQADGSQLTSQGAVVGSRLLGQTFDGEAWFQPRPSANDYDGLSSAPSNLGPSDGDLLAAIAKRRTDIAARDGVTPDQVPSDAVTGSASGLDAYVSPEYAAIQVARVARENGLTVEQVRTLVEQNRKGPVLGFLGQPVVNVVTLNLALSQAR